MMIFRLIKCYCTSGTNEKSNVFLLNNYQFLLIIRLVELAQSVLVPLCAYLSTRRGTSKGIAFVDSTPLPKYITGAEEGRAADKKLRRDIPSFLPVRGKQWVTAKWPAEAAISGAQEEKEQRSDKK